MSADVAATLGSTVVLLAAILGSHLQQSARIDALSRDLNTRIDHLIEVVTAHITDRGAHR